MFTPGVFTQSANFPYGYATFVRPISRAPEPEPEPEPQPELTITLGGTAAEDLPVYQANMTSEYLTVPNNKSARLCQKVGGTYKLWSVRRHNTTSLDTTVRTITTGLPLLGYLYDSSTTPPNWVIQHGEVELGYTQANSGSPNFNQYPTIVTDA